jgi:ADP-glucose pyrophosphorylase
VSLKKLNVEFRRDLVAVDLFVCTVEVLKSFKETEEHQTMHDFIVGMLTSEVYEEKIIVYELKGAEVALRTNRAADAYLAYMNFICGYFFPYSLYGEDRLSKMHRDCDKLFTVAKYHRVYRKGTKVAANVRLSNNIYIGQNAIIEKGCSI